MSYGVEFNIMNRAILCVWAMRLCGAVLLVAVALKVQMVASVNGVGQSLTMLSPRVQLLGIEFEALVGVWLISGYARNMAWLAGVLLFSALAAVSIYLIAFGQASCGCFGRVEVSPWASLTLDVASVALLLLFRPVWQATSARTLLRPIAAGLAIIAFILVGTSDVAGRQFARLRGESLWVRGDVDAGPGAQNDMRGVLVTVENLTGTDVRLIGGTSSCSCLAIEDLPTTIPAGGQSTLHVTIKYIGDPGEFRHTFVWHTDAPGQPRVAGNITGRVEVSGK